MSDTDLQLLARYTRDHAEDAFSELVRRHLGLVHSAALRQVRSPQLAEEIAQSVFTDLARNATKLKPDTILTAWLYQVTRRTAIDVVRKEARRQLREQIATEMNAMNATTADWTHIEPLLDDAMSALDDTDRAAVLLRYFENKTLREVGATLGTSDDAAQKRVSRAVERLREFFAKRGVTVGASGLVVVISANAVQAAPVGLAVTISTAAALTGTTAATTATAIAIKTIAMTTLQKTLITATVAVLAGAGIYEVRQAARLRDQVQTLQQQQAPLAEQIQRLQRERDESIQRLATIRDDNERLNRNSAEMLKLRGEVAKLRNDSQELATLKAGYSNDPVFSEAIAWRKRVNLLKQHFDQNPGDRIPEMQSLDELHWLEAAKISELSEVVGVARAQKDDARYDALGSAVGAIKEVAKETFANKMVNALRKFIEANAGELPTQVTQLKPYFIGPVGDDVLERYEMLHSGNVKDVAEYDRKCALISEKKSVADTSTQMMIQIGDASFRNLSSY
jgi:RNA polymerase sigma factor (sigma-70 family)